MLMLIENIFPPIPSEIILPLSGFMSAQGELNPFALLASSTAGAVAGALFWYYIGFKMGEQRVGRWIEKHSRWLALSTSDYHKIERFFDRHSGRSVFFGRMIPTFRSLISLPAGIFAMGMTRFLIYTTLGSMIWNSFLIYAGYALGDEYSRIAGPIGWVANIIVAGIVILYLYRLITPHMHKK